MATTSHRPSRKTFSSQHSEFSPRRLILGACLARNSPEFFAFPFATDGVPLQISLYPTDTARYPSKMAGVAWLPSTNVER